MPQLIYYVNVTYTKTDNHIYWIKDKEVVSKLQETLDDNEAYITVNTLYFPHSFNIDNWTDFNGICFLNMEDL